MIKYVIKLEQFVRHFPEVTFILRFDQIKRYFEHTGWRYNIKIIT